MSEFLSAGTPTNTLANALLAAFVGAILLGAAVTGIRLAARWAARKINSLFLYQYYFGKRKD